MSVKTKDVRDTFSDQLASFDDKLHATADDVDLLANIEQGISVMLMSAGANETEIRNLLHERYKSGKLRKETFQLVESMLERIVSENVPTSPTSDKPVGRQAMIQTGRRLNAAAPTSARSDDAFGTTTVIPTEEVDVAKEESRVQVGSVLRDRFLLQKRVAGGSMGVVYKALDRRLAEAGSEDHWVAIKVLSPQLAKNGQALRALQQEAAKGRCLTHPNIVRFIDLDREDDVYFLVMEWLNGQTLADILDSDETSSIDSDTAFRIVRQVGDALDYAHRCGIVHADIKPGNIMILPNGDAKLFDFGVARVRQEQNKGDFDPGVLGAVTPAYSSMQVLTGEEPTATDDVFSLGCLLYRLLAGYRVFGPRNAAEASEDGMRPQVLTSVSQTQWQAIRKSLAYARVARFSSVRDFLEALDAPEQTQVAIVAPERIVEKRGSGAGKWVIGLLLLVGIASIAAYQQGYLQPYVEQIRDRLEPDTALVDLEEVMVETPAEIEPDTTLVFEPLQEVPPETADEPETTDEPEIIEPISGKREIVGPDPMLVDFSALAPPTIEIPISLRGGRASADLTLREDGGEAIVDFIRDGDLTSDVTLRLEEVGFSGNRSPWAGGQYGFSNGGIIEFPSGQARGRITLNMSSDPLREADQQSTLRLRFADLVNSEVAVVTVNLEDDDQRDFEARLPVNTIAFAASQASIRETDPAVQIDIVRFNPDDSPLIVGYSVKDITATEGEDYFGPGTYSVAFGPGQRSARLLIPLVRDTLLEGDEAFVVELAGVPDTSAMDVYQRIVVMIRDDVPQ